MGLKRKKYTREYKLRVIERSYEAASIVDLAQELGLSPNQIYNWRSDLAKSGALSFPGEGNQAQSAEEAEVSYFVNSLGTKNWSWRF